jgi:hypothetical protein
MLRARIPFKAVIITGAMNSGKTSFIEALIGRAVNTILGYGIDDSSIAFIHSYERDISEITRSAMNTLDLDRIKYLYLFNDDAPATNAFSRLFLRRENISEMQYYVMIRHRLERRGFKGLLVVIHATQVFNIIDKTFRSTSDLFLFKSYPMDPNDLKLIGMMVGKVGLAALASITYKLRLPNSFTEYLEGVYSAVAKLIRTKRLVKAYDKTVEETTTYKNLLSKINHVVIEPKHEVQDDQSEEQEPPKNIYRVEFYDIHSPLAIARRNGYIDIYLKIPQGKGFYKKKRVMKLVPIQV